MTDPTGHNPALMPEWMLPPKVRQVVVWGTLTVLPALAAFVGAVGPTWGLPHVQDIVLTINALSVFDGALVGADSLYGRHMSA